MTNLPWWQEVFIVIPALFAAFTIAILALVVLAWVVLGLLSLAGIHLG